MDYLAFIIQPRAPEGSKKSKRTGAQREVRDLLYCSVPVRSKTRPNQSAASKSRGGGWEVIIRRKKGVLVRSGEVLVSCSWSCYE